MHQVGHWLDGAADPEAAVGDHQKPVSADTLRVRLGVGAARARQLVKIVRSELEEQVAAQRLVGEVVDDVEDAAVMAA